MNPRRTIKPETVFETAAFGRSAISPRGSVHGWGTIADPGEVSERSKERAWKARNRVFPGSRVQIPLSPSIGKCFCWLALCEGEPTILPFKSECFVFVPLLWDG